LAQRGYDDRFGARPLRRTVQHHIEDRAAELLLEGKISAEDTVTAVVDGDEIRLEKRL
jgi:ATP-dependent Clp protease ATP-binding subunit ClpC